MSVAGNTEVPDKLARQLAGKCLYGNCRRKATPGAEYCREHHDAVKTWKREWARKQRRALRKAKRCRDCGKPAKKLRCKRCKKVHRTAERARATHSGRVERDSGRVEQTPRTKLEIHPDGYTRIRTIGRGVRGQKSRAELDDDLRSDLDGALSDVQAVRDGGIAALRTVAIAELGRVARREAHALVADRLLRAARMLEAVVESLCPGRVAEVGVVRAEARAGDADR